jgi:sarcosine oxidase gamma subunit
MTHQHRSTRPKRHSPLGDSALHQSGSVRVEDCSGRARFGCKGPEAPAWLSRCGYKLPAQPNRAEMDGRGILVARLALSEFLIEAVDGGSDVVAASAEDLALSELPTGLYPVAREDLVINVSGAALSVLLRQICSFDFSTLLECARSDEGPVVLSSMIGVGVVAWPHRRYDAPSLALWLDPSFAHYFFTTLLEVRGGIDAAAEPARVQFPPETKQRG